MFYKNDRMALFIDGVSLYGASKLLGFDIDYKLLRQEFSRRGKLVRIMYYTSALESTEYLTIRPLVDWLSYNGFNLVTNYVKDGNDSFGRQVTKGNIEVNMAVDALDLAPRLDHAVLVTGNGHLTPLVASLQRKGVRVTILSTVQGQPTLLSDELRRQADNFVELNELRELIGRPPSSLTVNGNTKTKVVMNAEEKSLVK
ncbi:NYN domain-containing protein [Yoonia sp. 67]|uniref:LabA-like NYN domain-containing protein n=1 Tax=Yoonia sp. 67 TaxID=3081449 RepID=UPI002AFE8E1C|nr:NYN domain-containing protein [Yoonia sp. 67]